MTLRPAAPRRSWRPPSDLAAATGAVLGFTAVGLALSRAIGVPLGIPGGGDIPGLGTSIWVPPLLAALGYLAVQLAARLLDRRPVPAREIAARALTDYFLLALFILVIVVHFNIKMWVPVINPRLYDAQYFAVDQALRPVIDLFALLRRAVGAVLPHTDIWYQAGFFSIFVLSFLAHAVGARRWHYHNVLGLLLVEMIGPLTYLIAPAVGPFVFEHGPNAMATAAELSMYDVYRQVQSGGAAWLALNGAGHFAEPLAAMPSLHVGASAVVVYYALRARLRVAPLIVFLFAWIVVESVVARWHYLVDLPAGLAVAALAIALANRLCRRRLTPADERRGRHA